MKIRFTNYLMIIVFSFVLFFLIQGYGSLKKFSFKDDLSDAEYEVVVQRKRGFNEKS